MTEIVNQNQPIVRDNLDKVVNSYLNDKTHNYVSLMGQELFDVKNGLAQNCELELSKQIRKDYPNSTDSAIKQVIYQMNIEKGVREFTPPVGKRLWKNGVLDVRTGEFKEFAGNGQIDDIFMAQIPFDYNPRSEDDTIKKQIESTFTDPEHQKIYTDFIGYCHMDWTCGWKVMLMVYGDVDTKKTQTNRLVLYTLGLDNVSDIPIERINKDPVVRYSLIGKCVNYIDEMPSVNIGHSIVKNLLNGSPIEVKRLYHNPFSTPLKVKLLCAGNTVYDFDKSDPGMLEKVRLVTADWPIESEIRKRDYADYIARTNPDAFSGFMNYLLRERFPELLKCEYFPHDQSVDHVMEECLKARDKVRAFISEVFRPNPESHILNEQIKLAIQWYSKEKVIPEFKLNRVRKMIKTVYPESNLEYAYCGNYGIKGIKLSVELPKDFTTPVNEVLG